MNSKCDEAGLHCHDPQLAAGLTRLCAGTAIEPQPADSRRRGDCETKRPDFPVVWLRAAAATLPSDAATGSAARAILSELSVGVQRLIERGEAYSIDLRVMKSMPEERAALAAMLGQGEVSAVVDAIGRSEIQETAIPCVWWIRHRNSNDEIVGETIEVADIPEILLGDRQAAAHALSVLTANQHPGAD